MATLKEEAADCAGDQPSEAVPEKPKTEVVGRGRSRMGSQNARDRLNDEHSPA